MAAPNFQALRCEFATNEQHSLGSNARKPLARHIAASKSTLKIRISAAAPVSMPRSRRMP